MQQTLSISALSVVQVDWLTSLKQAWQTDLVLTQLIDDLLSDSTSHEGYSWSHGILTDKGKLVVS